MSAAVEDAAVEGAAAVEVDSVSVPVAEDNEIFEFCTVQCMCILCMFYAHKNRIMIIQNFVYPFY
jgi:hypothetical protein